MQPVEPFWVLVREAAAIETYDRLADLRRVVRRRCRRLAEDWETVLGAIGFHWVVGWNYKGLTQDGMTDTLTARCRWLAEQTEFIAGAVGFHLAVAA